METQAVKDWRRAWSKTEAGRASRKVRAERFRLKRLGELARLKLTVGCADCGFNEHSAALDFHHLPGFEKIGNVADLAFKVSWEKVLAEIAKCEVLCANCHRVRNSFGYGHGA